MENIFLLKIEVFVFFVSFFYILYYLGEKILHSYFKFKKIVTPRKNKKEKDIKSENNKEVEQESINLFKKDKEKNLKTENSLNIKCLLTQEDKDKILEILKKVKINTQKGYYDSSKSLIIEGLTIDKFNKDLNLELAYIYEQEKNFKNSEFIYKDLLLHYKNDSEIMKKLGFNLAMQGKLKKSFEVYENTFKKRRNDLEVLDMLTDISYDLQNFNKALKYVNIFLKEKPRDVEKLFIKAHCLEEENKKNEAIDIYKKILNLQPYNTKARDRIKALDKSI